MTTEAVLGTTLLRGEEDWQPPEVKGGRPGFSPEPPGKPALLTLDFTAGLEKREGQTLF